MRPNETTSRYRKNAYFSYDKSGRTPPIKTHRGYGLTCHLQVLRPRAASTRPLEPSYSKPMLNPENYM